MTIISNVFKKETDNSVTVKEYILSPHFFGTHNEKLYIPLHNKIVKI